MSSEVPEYIPLADVKQVATRPTIAVVLPKLSTIITTEPDPLIQGREQEKVVNERRVAEYAQELMRDIDSNIGILDRGVFIKLIPFEIRMEVIFELYLNGYRVWQQTRSVETVIASNRRAGATPPPQRRRDRGGSPRRHRSRSPGRRNIASSVSASVTAPIKNYDWDAPEGRRGVDYGV